MLYLYNYKFKGNHRLWNYLVAFPVIPAIFAFILIFLLFPDSPKHLLYKCKNEKKAKRGILIIS